LCDPEIASRAFYCDSDKKSIFFCVENCASEAIDKFFSQHEFNAWCEKVLKKDIS